MRIAGLNALADTILAAQMNDRTAMGIAFSIAAAGQHLTPELKAELERLRLLQNAQPAELSEAQTDALSDAGNGALNDHYHERQCACSEWPAGCVSSGVYSAGHWDTAAFDIGMAAVIGAWESMRAPAEADEISRLRALVTDLEAAAYGDSPVRVLEPVAQIEHTRSALAAQMHRADTLDRICREQRERADAAEIRVTELEAERSSLVAARDAQIIAWLNKKAREYGESNRDSRAKSEAVWRMADKLSRGAVPVPSLEGPAVEAVVRPCDCPAAAEDTLYQYCGAPMTGDAIDCDRPFGHEGPCRDSTAVSAGRDARRDASAEKLRTLLAGQREDPHDSPLHHAYTTGRDLPEVSRG